MQSNIYEYILDRFPCLPEVLRLCGADKKYIGKNASDFEKFRELCRVLVRFSGSDLYKDINLCVSELFGEKIDVAQSAPQDLWKKFYNHGESIEITEPHLEIHLTDIKVLTNTVNIRGVSGFVRPDKYHVSLAREKMQRGQSVYEDEKNMLIMQELRETAEQCIKASKPLVILADCPIKITYLALEYLNDCKLLPKTLILTDISGVEVGAAGLLEFEEVSLGVVISNCDERSKDLIRSLAAILPVGNILWALKKEDFDKLAVIIQELSDEWQRNSVATEKYVLKFEEICIFYLIKLLTTEKS